MPRPASSASIDAAVRDALDDVVRRASVAIAKAVAEMAAARLESELERGVAKAARPGKRAGRAGRPARARKEMVRWVADRRARRVPNFVIDLTGLATKKQIVARFGEDAVFEKGKAAPKAR